MRIVWYGMVWYGMVWHAMTVRSIAVLGLGMVELGMCVVDESNFIQFTPLPLSLFRLILVLHMLEYTYIYTPHFTFTF